MEHLILTLIQSILPKVFLISVNSSHCSPSFHAIFVSSSLPNFTYPFLCPFVSTLVKVYATFFLGQGPEVNYVYLFFIE